MSRNVLLPLSLVDRIIQLLGYWDVSEYDVVIQFEYDDILRALNMKNQKRELRDVYAKMIHADNEDDRFNARIRYLQQKNNLADMVDPPF